MKIIARYLPVILLFLSSNPLQAIVEQIKMRDMAYDLKNQGKYEEAEYYFRQQLSHSRAELPMGRLNDSRTVQPLTDLASLLRELGRYEEAISCYEQALEGNNGPGGSPYEEAKIMEDLASALRELGEYEKAMRYLTKSLEFNKKYRGFEHSETKRLKEKGEKWHREMKQHERDKQKSERWIIGTGCMGGMVALVTLYFKSKRQKKDSK